ncbi:MAG TPA: efflux RND transporter periplasmic adaptor subunit [Terriglobales bacterium]|nr:efflux RND transporter periplasmic adaptor subunit [Terriglobales bacterium]
MRETTQSTLGLAAPGYRGAGLLLFLSLLLPAAGCGDRSASEMTSYSARAKAGEQAQLFTVPPEQMPHVQVATVESVSLPRRLRLTGTVAFDGFHTTPVITEVGGPVSRILVSPGQKVKAGQVLLYVSSPDYAQARAAYLKARSAYDLAEKNYTRAQDLYAHHAIAERDLQQAESDRNQAQADFQAAEEGLQVLGVAHPEALGKLPATSELPLLAPISGEVVERLVAPGQLIQSGATQCFTISNMSTVWVLANIYQNALAEVHVGDPVSIQADTYPDVFQGRISYIAAALDPGTRTLQARIDTQNPGEKLKKDMYVTATVEAGTIAGALVVPDAAVLRDAENQPFVYVLAGQNQFGRRPVQLGESQGGRTQITSGLKAGEKVAGDGSLFLQFANSLQQ